MTAWTKQGVRMDLELAVAMEVGAVLLGSAEGELQRAKAADFSRRLWSVAYRLAALVPSAEHAADVMAAATQVDRGQPPAAIQDLNRRFAAILAGRTATHGALKRLLEDWRAHCRHTPEANFGSWVVDRLSALAGREQAVAA